MGSVALPPAEQGQLVSVRSRNWMVTDVSASTLPPERLQTALEAPQHLLTLSSVEDDGLGEELNVIWELEPGASTGRARLPFLPNSREDWQGRRRDGRH